MKWAIVSSKLINLGGRRGLILRKHSPEIFLVMGITGVVTSAVMACKATLKCDEVLSEHEDKMTKIELAREKFSTEEYTEQDYKKDKLIVNTQTFVGFVRLYGPSLTLGAISIMLIINSHRVIKSRNVALMAAYKTIEESFMAYRKRVREEEGGEERDYMYRHGLRAEKVIENEVDEKGNVKEVPKTILVADPPNERSQYSRFYDDGCTQWSKSPEYNLAFLRQQQNYWNDILQIRGHVFLNEVYDSLGIPRTKAGAVVGWALKGDGDNYIDFGIFDKEYRGSRNFVNGYEPVIILDFNVDGVIWDLL